MPVNNKIKYAFIVLIAAFYFLTDIVSATTVRAYEFSDWEHGASGYNRAVAKAQEEEKPLIVYFRTSWCRWCKKMNNDYLASREVEHYLSTLAKVEINTDKGADEKALCNQYGVKGYPSFIVVIPSFNSKAKKIYPFLKSGNMTTGEFVQSIKNHIAYQYNNKGYLCVKNKEYESAMKYYKMTLDFDPENAYAYYGLGMSYHSIAYNKKDRELLKKAEENYLRALEIDPKHQESKKELEKLRAIMVQ